MSKAAEEKLDEILKLFSDEEILSEFSKRRSKVINSYLRCIEMNEYDMKDYIDRGCPIDREGKQELRDENKFYKELIKRNEKINKLIEQVFRSLDEADELPE